VLLIGLSLLAFSYSQLLRPPSQHRRLKKGKIKGKGKVAELCDDFSGTWIGPAKVRKVSTACSGKLAFAVIIISPTTVVVYPSFAYHSSMSRGILPTVTL
jgi:hypothetical protein